MWGLLAKLGSSVLGLGRGYRALDQKVGGFLPGGVPRGTRGPMQRPGGMPGGPSRFVGPAAIGGGAVVGTAMTRGMRGPGAVGPPPSTALVPRGQMAMTVPGQRMPILWVQENPMGFKGYRRNKSSYYRTDPATGQVVHVPKGTAWVRYRRTNPLNPRAASRAIRRIEAGKRATEEFKRITIRKRK